MTRPPSGAARARPVVALDGPAGVGKSTTARALAERLGFVLVDTGALYRGVALAARERGVPWSDAAALGALAGALDLRFEPASAGREGGRAGEPRLLIDGRDRSDEIRTQEVAQGASEVSAHPPVRDALLGLQRRLGAAGGVVLEGRDIGTVVFPDAEVKVFLTASNEERARRRVDDLRARGQAADYDTVLARITARDAADAGRAVAPLRPADDAVVLDSTRLGFEEVLARIEGLVHAAMG